MQDLKPLIVGNWKMFNNVTDSIKLVSTLRNLLGDAIRSEVVVAPPYTSLYSVAVVLQETPIKLGAQNCFWEDEGPYTGEVSAAFLKDVGCEYVIIGHSERRIHFQESDEIVCKKIHAVLNNDLTPILCIGETENERKLGKTIQVIEQQLRKGLLDVGMHDLEKFAVAYEPMWAIGTGDAASSEQIEEAHGHIYSYLSRIYDAPTANNIRILYGGSVKAGNITQLMQIPRVNGVLVGGTSLKAQDFAKIVQYQERMEGAT